MCVALSWNNIWIDFVHNSMYAIFPSQHVRASTTFRSYHQDVMSKPCMNWHDTNLPYRLCRTGVCEAKQIQDKWHHCSVNICPDLNYYGNLSKKWCSNLTWLNLFFYFELTIYLISLLFIFLICASLVFLHAVLECDMLYLQCAVIFNTNQPCCYITLEFVSLVAIWLSWSIGLSKTL